MINEQHRQTNRQRLFTCLRYGGLLVTAIGVVMMFVPGACPTMFQGIEGYMILSGSIMNAIGRIRVAGQESGVRSREPVVSGSSLTTENSPLTAIAEGLQDVALIL